MAEKGKPVKLLKDPSKMRPEDRVRYYLGLPQGYPINPKVAEKALTKLKSDIGFDPVHARQPLLGRSSRGDRKLTPLEKELWGDLTLQTRSVHSRTTAGWLRPDEAQLFGFRNKGESLSAARARQRAARAVVKKKK